MTDRTAPADPPVVADALTPEVVARIKQMRDAFGREWQPTGSYYCVRCHHSHFEWTTIGTRHAVAQPTTLVLR